MKRKTFTLFDTATDKVLVRTNDFKKVEPFINDAKNVCNLYAWVNQWKEIILAIINEDGYLFKSKYFEELTK